MRKTLAGLAILLALASCKRHTMYEPAGERLDVKVPSPTRIGVSFTVVDWDKDGDLDVLAANEHGYVFTYTKDPEGYTKGVEPIIRVHSGTYEGSSIAAADADNDGDIDIYAADAYGDIMLYKNKGNNTF
jgi:hypothetical protein